MKTTTVSPGFHPKRHDRLLEEENHDPYATRSKLPEPTLCPQCNAVFTEGHWAWQKIPPQAHHTLCPACRRINDDFPAGILTLQGPFFQSHREEIVQLIHNQARQARQEHALQRIMKIEEKDGGVQIMTTDIHLARRCGEAVHHAYQGTLEFHYNPAQTLLRVDWRH